MEIIRTDSSNQDFIALVKSLDKYLSVTDGDEHAFYDQYNKLHNIKYVVLAYQNNEAVGCGAIKAFDDQSYEVKRMYTDPEHRGQGLAGHILNELESWASQLGAIRCILETGVRQKSAVRLYKKCHYTTIDNYGQYAGMENSICFEKSLSK